MSNKSDRILVSLPREAAQDWHYHEKDWTGDPVAMDVCASLEASLAAVDGIPEDMLDYAESMERVLAILEYARDFRAER